MRAFLFFLMHFLGFQSKVKVVFFNYVIIKVNILRICCSACQATPDRTARSKSTSVSRIRVRMEALASTWWDITSAPVLQALWVR